VRHEKAIEWQDKDGVVERSAANVEDLAWHDLAAGDKSVMVLFRHQKQAWKLGYRLQDLNIPYTSKGSSIVTSPKALVVKIYLNMRHKGGSATSVELNKMFKAAGDTAAANAVRKIAPDDPTRQFTMAECPSNIWSVKDWPKLFAKWDSERRSLNTLRSMVNLYGIDVIGKQPTIDISTYHGSKGREADIVILNTDCYKRTWDDQLANPDVETRLCYVGVTRAREKALILLPRSDMYMRALVEN